MSRLKYFTMIELLLVIVIVAGLFASIFVALKKSHDKWVASHAVTKVDTTEDKTDIMNCGDDGCLLLGNGKIFKLINASKTPLEFNIVNIDKGVITIEIKTKGKRNHEES